MIKEREEKERAQVIAAREEKIRAEKEKTLELKRAQEERDRQQKLNVLPTGTIRCKMAAMINITTGKETFMKGEDIWTLILNGPNATIISPKGNKDPLRYERSSAGPKSTGHIYQFTNSEIMEKIQLNIDNGASITSKTVVLIDFKQVGNMNIKMMGFCDI